MRDTRDRIRHILLFEAIALAAVTPLGGLVFGIDMSHFGVVAIVSTVVAMAWNYGFNLGFDHVMLRVFDDVRKSLTTRIVHAALFEAGLVTMLVPFIAWYLGVPLRDAFVMNIAIAGFFMVYAFVFNWAYDNLFPIEANRA
ncbi:hypothetical protein DLJ53_07830 [Acuticoccus sediminis]|uniref:Chlorhexidine efflux transporter domain-containing protein n=1 Tax=Acuticoccus sediminis TaxID=2184697 RepID=A0A8B2NY96_9HYPH|nr:PACE efflux transporter [Acuticoccus sediminis]RAI04343.1 hypothetical protein DLJ53_07830 [Acuticoccus sediminis]